MTSKEFEAWIDTYKEEVKETRVERPLTAQEIQAITDNIANIPKAHFLKLKPNQGFVIKIHIIPNKITIPSAAQTL